MSTRYQQSGDPAASEGPLEQSTERHLRGRIWPWTIGAVAVVVIAGWVVGMGGAIMHRGQRGDPLARYGQEATEVAARLHGCVSVKHSDTAVDVVGCVNVAGDYLGIQTTTGPDEQDYAVAMIRRQGRCAAVIKGVLITAPNKGALTEVVGAPEQFVVDHHGYLVCPGG
jgi:hypothetical protein